MSFNGLTSSVSSSFAHDGLVPMNSAEGRLDDVRIIQTTKEELLKSPTADLGRLYRLLGRQGNRGDVWAKVGKLSSFFQPGSRVDGIHVPSTSAMFLAMSHKLCYQRKGLRLRCQWRATERVQARWGRWCRERSHEASSETIPRSFRLHPFKFLGGVQILEKSGLVSSHEFANTL